MQAHTRTHVGRSAWVESTLYSTLGLAFVKIVKWLGWQSVSRGQAHARMAWHGRVCVCVREGFQVYVCCMHACHSVRAAQHAKGAPSCDKARRIFSPHKLDYSITTATLACTQYIIDPYPFCMHCIVVRIANERGQGTVITRTEGRVGT